jgi:hexosaminidase
MVKYSFIIFILFLSISCKNEIEVRQDVEQFLIPKPNQIEEKEGYFKIDKKIAIVVSENALNEGNYLKKLLENAVNFNVEILLDTAENIPQKSIQLRVNSLANKDLSLNESYSLAISEKTVQINAFDNAGLMRGIQTLRQLFVDSFHGNHIRNNWYLPLVSIIDKPAFRHRGMLFDSCRHFFEIDVIKKYIDLLAFYKMNVFHWHLTEDQGWRIEIDRYPKLTEIGAYRTEEDGSIYGGFYTKKQIKEVVAYAAERHITVIPEIELPGHSQAALASYPQLSCTGDAIAVANKWGVFKDIYCAGNEYTFEFLENVLTEVLELFPSEYIHIGGDEAPKSRWESCPKCQLRIENENLNDEHELQSYFINRIEKFLNDNNRKIIGWDEILEGGLSPTATVQSWRGEQGAIVAANNNQYAIMSPTSHCYFDYDIASIDLEKVYNFNPIPSTLSEDKHKYILGGECNLWSEHIPDEMNLDSKVFPRLFAMTEVLWSYPKERNFDTFYNRVQMHYKVLENKNTNYGLEFIPLEINSNLINKRVEVSISPKTNEFSAKYRFVCDSCDTTFIPFSNKINLDKSGTLEVKPIKNGKNYGEIITQKYALHNALNANVAYKNKYSTYYTANGDKALVDGKIGTTNYKDGNWQGFSGDDIICVVDLGEFQKVNQVKVQFLHRMRSWIMVPKQVELFTSSDGENWDLSAIYFSKLNPKIEKDTIETVIFNSASENIRFIKLNAKNLKKLPQWHDAAGSEGWIFIDEIQVK